MSERLVAMAILLLVAIAFVALGVPLVRGSVPPNWLYGFRVPLTVKNPDLWYPANAYLGRWMIALGAALFPATIVLYFMPMGDEAYGLSIGAGLTAGTIAMFVACMIRLARLKRRRDVSGRGT